MTYNVFGGTLNLALSIYLSLASYSSRQHINATVQSTTRRLAISTAVPLNHEFNHFQYVNTVWRRDPIFGITSRPTHISVQGKLKTWLFGKSFPPQTISFPTGLIPRTLGPFNAFTLLNGWICLHGVLD